MTAAAASLAQIIHDHVTDEEWRDVPGYEGIYMASSHGRVKSLGRTTFAGRYTKMGKPVYKKVPNKLLSGSLLPTGHLGCGLSRDGVQWSTSIHRVVALTFHGTCPDGTEVCHNDGNPANNRPANLRYGTREENQADRILHGDDSRGIKHGKVKLTEFEVLYIRYLNSKGSIESNAAIARQYGVSERTISSLIKGGHWKHLPLHPTRAQVHEAFNVDVGRG